MSFASASLVDSLDSAYADVSYAEEEEEHHRRIAVSDEAESRRFLLKLWAGMLASAGGGGGGGGAAGTAVRSAPASVSVAASAAAAAGERTGPGRFRAEQALNAMLANNGRPRAAATPARPKTSLSTTRAARAHPRWAISAVGAALTFLGGGLGVRAVALARDDEAVSEDATRAMNEFFQKSKELSAHMSLRFSEMMQTLSEGVLAQAAPRLGSAAAQPPQLRPPPPPLSAAAYAPPLPPPLEQQRRAPSPPPLPPQGRTTSPVRQRSPSPARSVAGSVGGARARSRSRSPIGPVSPATAATDGLVAAAAAASSSTARGRGAVTFVRPAIAPLSQYISSPTPPDAYREGTLFSPRDPSGSLARSSQAQGSPRGSRVR